MLAQRMKKVMNILVANSQMTFVKGRQITDAVLIVNKCLDSRRQGEARLMCKLDMKKHLIVLIGRIY